MKCIRCGCELTDRSTKCPSCGSSSAVMKQLYKMSAKHYNTALSAARASNLSLAESELVKSVGCNKRNIQARNLLGLVYLETGEVGNAFKHWLLSASYKKQNNPAKAYLTYAKDNITEFDKMDIGIKLYNEALTILKRRYRQTEDADKLRRMLETTVDKLKKALEMNPRLLKAANLLTLCHIILGNRSRALEISKSVLYADISNPTALFYFNMLCPDRSRPPVKITGNVDKKQGSAEVNAPPIERQGFFTSLMFMEILAFLLGIGASVAVFCFLIMPGIDVEKTERIEALENKITAMESLARQKNSEGSGSEDNSVNSEISQKEEKIAKAKQLYDNYYYIDAAELIFGLDTSGVSQESLEIYNSIIYNVTVNASSALLSLGQKAYNEGNLEDASSFLTRAFNYSQNAAEEETELYNIKYNILLYRGIIAMDTDDKAAAVNLFTQIINSDADKKCVTYAENYLKSITEE